MQHLEVEQTSLNKHYTTNSSH